MSKMERPHVFVDKLNKRAVEAASSIHSYPADQADYILVLGGDGTMIKAIHALHNNKLPFYGMNFGHVGFLLNEPKMMPKDLQYYQLPLLRVKFYHQTIESWTIGVNDAWVERVTPQTARMSVEIDGTVRLKTIYADGLLVCTPQGSTAYARSMGGVPLPLDTKALQIVGSNVSYPAWKSALLGYEQKVRIDVQEREKRPIRLLVDGVIVCPDVEAVEIMRDCKRHVTLAFDKSYNLAEKIAKTQFPA